MAGTSKAELTLKIGEEFTKNLWLRIKKTGQAIDIQNTIWKAGVKEDIDNASQLQAFTMSDPFQDPEDGRWKVNMKMTAAEIAGLGISEGVWDIFYSDDAGSTFQKAGRGSFVVELKASDLT